jgi:hypothetical protein
MRDAVALAVRAAGLRLFHFAELGGEGELPFAAQRLAREYENVVRQKRAPDCVLFGRRQRP